MPRVDPKESQPEHIEHAEAQLRPEREELRGIVDLIPQTTIVLNPNGKAIYANRDALEYTGPSLDEVQSDDFRDRVFHHEDVQRRKKTGRKAFPALFHSKTSNGFLGKTANIGGS
jgi:PAS domain S-box-containing protein